MKSKASRASSVLSRITFKEESNESFWGWYAIYDSKFTIARLKAEPKGDIVHLADIKIDSQKELKKRISLERRLFINLNFQGVGLGSELIGRFLEKVSRANFTQITGNVTEDDANTTPYLLAWYESLGFLISENVQPIDGIYKYTIIKEMG